MRAVRGCRSPWILAGLLVALAVTGSLLWTRPDEEPVAPSEPWVTGVPVDGSADSTAALEAPPAEPVEDPRERAQVASPAHAPRAATAEPVDFAQKYAETSLPEMLGLVQLMNEELDRDLRRVADEMIAMGWYDEEPHYVNPSPGVVTGIPRAGTPPEGMSRVWPVQRVVPGEGDVFSSQTVYVTEVEHPEIFAKLDERLWLGRRARILHREREED